MPVGGEVFLPVLGYVVGVDALGRPMVGRTDTKERMACDIAGIEQDHDVPMFRPVEPCKVEPCRSLAALLYSRWVTVFILTS